MNRSFLLLVVCICCLFVLAPVPIQGQEKEQEKKVPSLQDAKTLFDIADYMDHESGKIDKDADKKQQAALRADIYMRASDKLLEIAKERNDISNAHSIRLSSFQAQIEAEIEGAQQKMEAFLDELAAKEETRYEAEGLRFQLFISDAIKTINTPEGPKAFKSGLKTWIYRNIDSDHMFIRVDRIGRGMLMVAEQRKDSAEQFATELIKELIEFIQSAECTLSVQEKATAVRNFEQTLELQQFGQFYMKSLETVNSPETFNTFKAELLPWRLKCPHRLSFA